MLPKKISTFLAIRLKMQVVDAHYRPSQDGGIFNDAPVLPS